MYTFWVIQVCMKIQDGVGGHLVWRISGFWAYRFVAALGLMLHSKFGEVRPYRSNVISISVSHWNAWERGFWPFLGRKNFGEIFWPPQRHLLGLNRFFWRIKRQNRFSGLGCTLTDETKNKTKKCHRRMNMSGMRRGKTPTPFFLNWPTEIWPRRNCICQFWLNFLQRFRKNGSKVIAFPLTRLIELTTVFPLPWEPVIQSRTLFSSERSYDLALITECDKIRFSG